MDLNPADSPNAADSVSADSAAVAIRSIHTMASGGRADFDTVFHANAVDRENRIQPPSSRVPGPAGFYSTALWLRTAFAGLHYHIHHALADGDLVAVSSTMNGRHVAPFVIYRESGEVDNTFPPPVRRSQWRKHIGSEYKAARSSSTGRFATTWGRQATGLATTNPDLSSPDGRWQVEGPA